jgi:hypothetical protein
MWAASSPATAASIGRDHDQFFVVDRGQRQAEKQERRIRRRELDRGAEPEPLAQDRLEGAAQRLHHQFLEASRLVDLAADLVALARIEGAPRPAAVRAQQLEG